MGSNNGKVFDIKGIDRYFGDLWDAIQSFERYATEHLFDVNDIVRADYWRGDDANTGKRVLTKIESEILDEIIALQKDVDKMDAKFITNFRLMVDGSSNAYISYNVLEQVNDDFKYMYDTFDLTARKAKNKVSNLQDRYSKYGYISTPNFSSGYTAFINMCGGDDPRSGFMKHCMNKMVKFDEEATADIKEANIPERIEKLNQKMCWAVHVKHPEYGLGQYVSNIDEFEEKYQVILAHSIMHKDIELWTIDEAMLVCNCYKNAVDNHDVQEIERFYNDLRECTYNTGTHQYISYLNSQKCFTILTFMQNMGYGQTEAYAALNDISTGGIFLDAEEGQSLTINISLEEMQDGYAINWVGCVEGQASEKYQGFIFNRTGLTYVQKYKAIDGEKSLEKYRQRLKIYKDIERRAELEAVTSNENFTEYSLYNQTLRKKGDLNKSNHIYDYLNDKSFFAETEVSRVAQSDDPYPYIKPEYLKMDDEQKRIYNYWFRMDCQNGTNYSTEYLTLITEELSEKSANEQYELMKDSPALQA